MKVLRAHFSDEGNTSRNKTDADRLKDTLYYKNERAIDFETFLIQYQKICNIYEKESKEMSKNAKIHFLFKHV